MRKYIKAVRIFFSQLRICFYLGWKIFNGHPVVYRAFLRGTLCVMRDHTTVYESVISNGPLDVAYQITGDHCTFFGCRAKNVRIGFAIDQPIMFEGNRPAGLE